VDRLNDSKLKLIPPKDLIRIQAMIIPSVFRSLVASGELDPTGKADHDLMKEFLQKLKEWAKNLKNGSALLIDEHRESLLTHARKFVKNKDLDIALFFYATWFEHWINSMMANKASKFGLNDQSLRLALLHNNLEAKFSCFPAFLKMPPIRGAHLKGIKLCARLRNEFVHYKYSASKKRGDTFEKEKQRQKEAISAAEKAVQYLSRYERRYVYKGAKNRIHKLVRFSINGQRS